MQATEFAEVAELKVLAAPVDTESVIGTVQRILAPPRLASLR
jgi:hypothetical protein